MEVPIKSGKDSGGAGAGQKDEREKPMAVYIEIKGFPREQKWSGDVEEEAGWLFVRK